MYYTNKKDLELNKIKEMHYYDKIEKIKTELSLKSILLKYLSWIALFLLMSLPLLTFAQIDTCNVCNSVNLSSTYNPILTHTWVCSDGQSSTEVNPTLTVTEDMLCILTVTDTICTVTDSIYIDNCDCDASVYLDIKNGIISAIVVGCTTPSYQWQKWNGSTWVNVGTNASTYNATTVSGLYKVLVTCEGCSGEAEIEYDGCVISIVSFGDHPTSTNTYALQANIGDKSVCADFEVGILYRETFEGSGVWDSVASSNAVFAYQSKWNISTLYTNPYGSFRLIVSGCGCSDTAYYVSSADPPSPCSGFSVNINSITDRCEDSDVFFSLTSSGQPFSSGTWSVDGTPLTSYIYGPAILGAHTVSVNAVSIYGCTFTDTETFNVIDCGTPPPPPPCTFNVEIDQGSLLLCSGVSQNFTTTVSNGTGPYTYTWSYILGGITTSQGSGATKTINFTTSGTYQIIVTVIDANGCTDTDILFVTVESCFFCDCYPSIELQGCLLIISEFGGGCSGWNWSLQYSSNNGTSWTTLTGGPQVTSVTYSPSQNGLYRIRISKSECGEVFSNVLNVTCVVTPCTNPPTVTLSGYTGLSCDLNPIIINGNSIGGSATNVTLTHNGAGSHNITWLTATTFRFTYFPTSADLGQTITIRLITNNPLGFPCLPQEVLFSAFVGEVLEPVITSSGAAMCVNSLRTLTATPFGGTWTVESGPGVISSGNILTATGVGTIVIGYQINSGGCFTGESMSITVTNCQPTLTYSNCLLTATFSGDCSGWNYQLQHSPTGTGWTILQNGAANNFTYTPTQTGVYRLLAVKTGCNSYSSEVTINTLGSGTITSSNSVLCIGQPRTLTATPTGGTFSIVGPATLSGNILTATGVGTITVTYSLGGCSTTQTIPTTSCACNGITMTYTTLPGRISFGTLNYNNIPMTNYQIEWRKCSDNSVAFISGMGTGSGSGIFSHPFNNLPLTAGCYYPFIVSSSQGDNLDCFADVNVTNWNCTSGPNYVYDGPGGTAATREFAMDIPSTITSIKISSYVTQTVADLLEVIYNGTTIYSATTQTTTTDKILIPITYVSGINFVIFRVSNTNPSTNTVWQLAGVSCCSGDQPCLELSDIPLVTSVTAAQSATCGCGFSYTYSAAPNVSCRDCASTANTLVPNLGGCSPGQANNVTTCYNETIVITKGTGANRLLDFSTSTNYLIVKNYLQAVSGDGSVLLYFKNNTCSNDGTLIALGFYPNRATIVYDDVNYTISITLPANPFPNNCESICNVTHYNNYQSQLAIFNSSTTNIGTYQSINQMITSTYTPTTPSAQYDRVIRWQCFGLPCTITLERKYRMILRDVNCPCQSWQLFLDFDNNGSYETLVQEASGWTGSCN